jgi:hypothetical protein
MRAPTSTMAAVPFFAASGPASAGIPLVNATCPGGIEVCADEGGPVFAKCKEGH